MGRALPVFQLDDISVASPCSMAWADMVGGDKVRFCGACQKNVFNLSGMARTEALDLIRATEGRMCVRFFRRADGTILTEDCPVGIQKALRRAKRMTLGALATTLGACAALIGFLSAGAMRKTCQHIETVRATVTQELDPVPVMGEPLPVPAVPVEETRPPREIMGKIAAPAPNVREVKGGLRKPPVREFMGDVAMPSGG